MSILSKYCFILLVTVALFAISTGVVYSNMRSIQKNIDIMVQMAQNAEEVSQIMLSFQGKDIIISDYAVFPTEDLAKKYTGKTEELKSRLIDLKERIDMPDAATSIEHIQMLDKDIDEIFFKRMTYAGARNLKTDIVLARSDTIKLRDESLSSLADLKSLMSERSLLAVNNVKRITAKTVALLVTFIAVSIIIGSLIMVMATRHIQKSLRSVIEASRKIANKNLDVEIKQYQGTDEIARLTSSMRCMADNLKNIVELITGLCFEVTNKSSNTAKVAEEVSSTAEIITVTINQISAGTEEQAEFSAGIANSVNILNDRIINAESEIEKIRKCFNNLLHTSCNGSKLMEDSMNSLNVMVNNISESSKHIQLLNSRVMDMSGLIDIIAGLSGQTNLLALNTAIEAAKAGEYGRGMRVLSEEIRKFSQQVSLSLINITHIIDIVK